MKTIWPLPKIEFMPFTEIEEKRPVALVTSGPAWNAVSAKLHLPVVWKVEVSQAIIPAWEAYLPELRGEVIYAVGGGLPVDAAKYLAVKKGLPLVCLPTALSVDAFVTWGSGIREAGCVRYIETKTPDLLIADFETIGAGPASIRAAGICDVLSITTGSWDWKYAAQKGKNPPGMEFISYVYEAAGAILQGALDCAEAAGRGDPQGLKQLLDCLALETQLLNQIGHARPEEGSEHYFAYAAENFTGPGWPHADLLAPGILLMMTLQGQDTTAVRKALRDTQIPLDRISETTVRQTLSGLADYCYRNDLPYGIGHELALSDWKKMDISKILR